MDNRYLIVNKKWFIVYSWVSVVVYFITLFFNEYFHFRKSGDFNLFLTIIFFLIGIILLPPVFNYLSKSKKDIQGNDLNEMPGELKLIRIILVLVGIPILTFVFIRSILIITNHIIIPASSSITLKNKDINNTNTYKYGIAAKIHGNNSVSKVVDLGNPVFLDTTTNIIFMGRLVVDPAFTNVSIKVKTMLTYSNGDLYPTEIDGVVFKFNYEVSKDKGIKNIDIKKGQDVFVLYNILTKKD